MVYVDGREKTNTCIELLKVGLTPTPDRNPSPSPLTPNPHQAVPGKTIVFVNTKRAADTLEQVPTP